MDGWKKLSAEAPCRGFRKSTFHSPEGSTFLELKRAGAWNPGARGKKSKHTDLDILHLKSDANNHKNLFFRFPKKRGPSHFGLSSIYNLLAYYLCSTQDLNGSIPWEGSILWEGSLPCFFLFGDMWSEVCTAHHHLVTLTH